MGFLKSLFGKVKEKKKINEKKDNPNKNVGIKFEVSIIKNEPKIKEDWFKKSGEKDKCPYCHEKLKKMPSRKKKCDFCGKYIRVRDNQLVTEHDAKEVDYLNRIKWTLETHGINGHQFKEEKTRLSKQFKKEASDRDVAWSLLNGLVIKYAADLQELKIIYYDMALFLNDEGKNPYDMLCESNKMKLLYYKNSGMVKKVKIFTAKESSCPQCRKLEGNKYDIDVALKEMPVPVQNCEHHIHEGKYGFCRCMWLSSEIEMNDERNNEIYLKVLKKSQ